MTTPLTEALHILEECARALMRNGGMLNKDLARDVTRFVSRAKAQAPKPTDQKAEA